MSRSRRSRDRGYISGNRIIAAPTYDEVIVNYLVIAGGGAGGDSQGGGGGAGGYRNSVIGELTGGGGSAETPLTLVTSLTYTVTVGAGGAAGTGTGTVPSYLRGNNGSNSVFHSITSTGGGGGGGWNQTSGNSGGSGGGAANNGNNVLGGTRTASPVQGFDGGAMSTYSNPFIGGGGGGAGAVGANGYTGGGNGGVGLASNITGSSVTRGGGGGGGRYTTGGGTTSPGLGGAGGGGNGGRQNDGVLGSSGTVNTGGGGGGSDYYYGGYAGGSGIVILRYSNLFTLNIGAGLSYSTQTVNDDKVTTFTGGSGSISLSPAPVTTGDYESIATVLVGSAGTSSITFSNIPQTYKHLQIRFNYSANANNDNTHIRFNGDTSASYSWHEMYGSSSESPGSVLSSSYGGTLVTTAKFGYAGSTSAGFTGVGTSDILDYTNTNKIKVARHLVGTHTNGSASYIIFRSVAWHNTGAITSITIYFPPGLITQHSHFALYGIRG